MTTREELVREREALVDLLDHLRSMPVASTMTLRTSIARIDALLSLTDAQAAYLVTHSVAIAYADEDDAEHCDDVPAGELRPSETAAAHRAVAELVRRA